MVTSTPQALEQRKLVSFQRAGLLLVPLLPDLERLLSDLERLLQDLERLLQDLERLLWQAIRSRGPQEDW
jgi:hypothetical protein